MELSFIFTVVLSRLYNKLLLRLPVGDSSGGVKKQPERLRNDLVMVNRTTLIDLEYPPRGQKISLNK